MIEAVTFAVMNEAFELPYWPCYLVALLLSIVWNFTLNREFTFKASNNIPIAMLKVGLFYAIFIPVSTCLGNYLAETRLWNAYLVTGLNMLANFTLEYLYDRFIVFGDSIDSKEKSKQNS